MADARGDESKQPAECTISKNNRCPNIKCTYEGYDGERYRCETCGESYFLNYEDMQ